MAIITLTTDFGENDFHTSSLKGAIYNRMPEAIVVDISHQVAPFDLLQTAYLIRNSYRDFPKGTVHLIGVDALPNPLEKPIAAEINGHFFIANDNGILSLIAGEFAPDEIIEITINKYEDFHFLAKELFVPVACHLARGGKIGLVGRKMDFYKELTLLKPVENIDNNTITGMIIYIDNYGNVVTNISEKLFYQFGKRRNFTFFVRNEKYMEIKNKYTDVVEDFSQEIKYHGRTMALFNSSGYLQVSLYKSNLKTVGGASSLLGLEVGVNVRVVFENP
ncbi:MAG: SAM-dependent chlorinase/fluorinase [Flavobacteriaceae bacterium]|jgi:S-adenosylmethionine hydrolase|nr:SAM-dependent chlorinase/fluorinase [Flavobacteriaceae bacterium]